MTKQKIVEVRDDLNRLIDALNPGSPRAAVARAVEKLDAIIRMPDCRRDHRIHSEKS